MPAPPFINGLKKPYNRVFLSSLRSRAALHPSVDSANNKRTNKVQFFLMCFILQNELSTALMNVDDKKISRGKLTYTAILTVWFCMNDINM